jgi:hypothetical protein
MPRLWAWHPRMDENPPSPPFSKGGLGGFKTYFLTKPESRVPGENRDPVFEMAPDFRRDDVWTPVSTGVTILCKAIISCRLIIVAEIDGRQIHAFLNETKPIRPKRCSGGYAGRDSCRSRSYTPCVNHLHGNLKGRPAF